MLALQAAKDANIRIKACAKICLQYFIFELILNSMNPLIFDVPLVYTKSSRLSYSYKS